MTGYKIHNLLAHDMTTFVHFNCSPASISVLSQICTVTVFEKPCSTRNTVIKPNDERASSTGPDKLPLKMQPKHCARTVLITQCSNLRCKYMQALLLLETLHALLTELNQIWKKDAIFQAHILRLLKQTIGQTPLSKPRADQNTMEDGSSSWFVHCQTKHCGI